MLKVKYEDLSEKVYKALKEMILTSELKPGMKLVQEDLSERLGVSRTPILAAFSKLEKELLIELIPRHGAYVRKCELSELYHFVDIRLRLEPLGAREAAQEIDEPGIAALRGVFETYRQAVESGDKAQIKEKDYRFHMEIMKQSKNFVLLQILSSFNIVVISNQRGLLKPARRSLAEHQALLDAIVAKNPDEAERRMQEHLVDIRKGLSYPDRDE
jgi:DNA-binding GntR family transcriptional regulator